jgi:hypothetical protein
VRSRHANLARAKRELAFVAVFAVIAIVLTWPLVRELERGIPLGTETVATVPLVSLWALWWNVDRIGHGFSGYWDAPIFHPVEGAFAFSEAQPLSGLVTAALAPLTGSLLAAYNIVLLLALALNGWLGYRLVLTLELGVAPAFLGGVLIATLPFVHQELGVLPLVPLGGLLMTLACCVHFARDPGLRTGAFLGLALSATYLLCGYYGVMVGLLLALTLPFLLVRRIPEPRLWKGVATAAVVAAILILPIALPQLAAVRSQGFERSAAAVREHSAEPRQYLRAAWPTLLPAPAGVAPRPSGRAFWPGSARVLLAILGVAWACRRPGARRWAMWFAALGLLGFLLSLGPRGAIGPFSLHSVLAFVVPGYAQMRSLFRCAVVLQLAVSVLAAMGVAALWNEGRRRHRARSIVAGLVAVVCCVDLWPRMGEIQPLPPLRLDLAWLEWIESETPEDAVFAFIPFPKGRSVGDYEGTAHWMYWQMRHARPMVNGYSSFFPKSFKMLKNDLMDFPDARGVARLGEHGVDYCVVHRAFAPREAVQAAGSARSWLDLVATDDGAGIDIYRVRVGDRRH